MPRVRILGEFSDTPARQFPVSTALQLTCEGQVGNDASKVRTRKEYFDYVPLSCSGGGTFFAMIDMVETSVGLAPFPVLFCSLHYCLAPPPHFYFASHVKLNVY